MIRREPVNKITGRAGSDRIYPLGTGKLTNKSDAMIWTVPMLTLPSFGALIGVNEMTFVKTFIRDESGASAAEYALILAVVGAGIAFAAFSLGGAISNSIDDATNEVNTCSAGDTSGCSA